MLIGLHGFKGSGKTTAATHLCNAHGFDTYAIASPLRAILREMNPPVDTAEGSVMLSDLVSRQGWDGLKVDPLAEASVRRYMVSLGQGLRSHVGPDALLYALQRTIGASDKPLVISDVRLDREAVVVRAAGGLIVRITRPHHEAGADTTESGLSPSLVDLTVANDGHVSALHDRLDILLLQRKLT